MPASPGTTVRIAWEVSLISQLLSFHFEAKGDRASSGTRGRGVLRLQAVSILAFLILNIAAQGQASPSAVQDIIRRSAEATRSDWERAPDFDFCELDKWRNGSKTYEVLMIAGSPYNRLVAVDGIALSVDKTAGEARKLQVAVDERGAESTLAHQQRVAQYEKERRRDHLLLEQLPEAMDFTLIGTDQIGAFHTYVFEAHPKRGYIPKTKEASVLTGMRGKLWIDQTSFRWVKVEAEVTHAVMIAGFLARVEPGTQFHLDEMPVGTDIWLPSHFSLQLHAKVFFFFDKSDQRDVTYFQYVPNGAISPESCRQTRQMDNRPAVETPDR